MEDTAVKYLENLGYIILARNFWTRFGEIDIISTCSGTIVFTGIIFHMGIPRKP